MADTVKYVLGVQFFSSFLWHANSYHDNLIIFRPRSGVGAQTVPLEERPRASVMHSIL